PREKPDQQREHHSDSTLLNSDHRLLQSVRDGTSGSTLNTGPTAAGSISDSLRLTSWRHACATLGSPARSGHLSREAVRHIVERLPSGAIAMSQGRRPASTEPTT